MYNFAMFNKTYKGDFERFKILKNSIDKYNKDSIPFYVSCPSEDIKLFESLITGKENYKIEILDDSTILKKNFNKDKYIEQQLVKMYFGLLDYCDFYLIIDSDSYFIRDFSYDDFMFNENTPYIVMHEGKDSRLINSSVGESNIYVLEEQVKNYFQRKGKNYRFLTTPIIFSKKVLSHLKDINSFEELLEIVPSEAMWHGECLLKTKCINFIPCEPFFKAIVYEGANELYSNVLNITEEEIAKIYLGIVMQANHNKNILYQVSKKSLFYSYLKHKILYAINKKPFDKFLYKKASRGLKHV